MSDCIERKKIIDFCNVVINRQGNEKEMNVVVESFKAFSEYVKAIPTADVQPVVHGEWIHFDSDAEKYDDIKCSNCERSFTVDAYRWCDIGFTEDDLKFCPNCGAKMDGKGADNGTDKG